MRWHLGIIVLAVVGLFILSVQATDKQLAIFPRDISLSSRESRQTIVVQWQMEDQLEEQAIHGLSVASSDENIVRIENGQAVPVANGKATIRAQIGEQAASAEVTVTGMQEAFAWSFRNHVESVLSKQGCNGGACHGARAGQ